MVMSSNKSNSLLKIAVFLGGVLFYQEAAISKTYLTTEEAATIFYQNNKMQKIMLSLTKEQMKSIKKESGVRVRNSEMNIWRTDAGDWYIVDNVIGKHENIDIAVAITKDGKVKGVEVLTYRETYGYEVMNKKWLAQFKGKDNTETLKLDKQIKNISGATLSCRHVTDGVNRLTETWAQILRYL